MTNKRILSLVLALLMMLTILPTAIAETESDTVYAYSAGGIDFYACDETGTTVSETLVDPNTVTHLYLAPQPEQSVMYPLLIEDRSALRWVTVLNPENYDLYLYQDLFSNYVNLSEVHLPDTLFGADFEILENTAVRSFTLPECPIDPYFFQGCNTIEEIINPTANDVTLDVYNSEITIPAGGTWKAEFDISSYWDYFGTPAMDFSLQLQAIGADKANPVTWSLTQDIEVPEGITLTEDGLLTGKLPAEHNGYQHVYVTAKNGENTAKTSVYLAAYDPLDVTINLPEGVTLKDGPNGEKSYNRYGSAVWTFETDLEGVYLCDVTLAQIDEEGSIFEIDSYNYIIRGNSVYLAAEATYSDVPLTITPCFAVDHTDAIQSATPLTFPCEETVADANYVYFSHWGSAYETKVFKADLKLGQAVSFTWAHPEQEQVDTLLAVFTKENDILVEKYYCDNDSVGEYGESGTFVASKDGTYYFFVSTYNVFSPVGCQLVASVSDLALPKDIHLTKLLDFTDPDNLPSPDEDGCWVWDVGTKTLTLKDGFAMLVEDDNAINLPANATVKVEGQATIVSYYNAISAFFNLTVELGDKAHLTLFSFEGIGVQLEEGQLTVNGQNGTSKLTVLSPTDDAIMVGRYEESYDSETDTVIPLPRRGNVQIKDTILTIDSGYDAIESYEGNIVLENCNATIDSVSDGFYVDSYDVSPSEYAITLKNCTLHATCEDQVFDNPIGPVTLIDSYVNASGCAVFEVWDTVTVEGGRLVAEGIKGAPVAWFYASDYVTEDTVEEAPMYFTVKDATFYLTFQFPQFTNATEIELPGELVIADRDNRLMYHGPWDIHAISETIKPEESIYPALIASVLNSGDADADGSVSATDALQVLKSVVGKVSLDKHLAAVADVDGDQSVAAKDALLILQKVVGKIEKFPVEEIVM